MVGSDRRWIDEAAPGRVDFLYGGEQAWSGGGPVWANLFWNGRIDRAEQLFGAEISGPAPVRRDVVLGDGRIRGSGTEARRYVVAAARLQLAGTALTSSDAGFVLWRADEPLRIVARRDGVDLATETLAAKARLVAYACRGGSVALILLSPDNRVVRLWRNGVLYRAVRLRAEPWSASIPFAPPPRPGRQACTLSLTGASGVRAARLDFLRP
jgi:hypothetical protein